jgi:hypothetical protein
MAGLKSYSVNVNGMAATLRLSDVDAKKRGLTAADLVGAKKATPPKARPAATKNVPAPPLNKSRTAAEKAE